MEKEKTKFFYLRENAFQSIVSDTFMFLTLIGAMALNHFYFGDSSAWALFLFLLVLTATIGRVKKRGEVFYSAEELKKFINEML